MTRNTRNSKSREGQIVKMISSPIGDTSCRRRSLRHTNGTLNAQSSRSRKTQERPRQHKKISPPTQTGSRRSLREKKLRIWSSFLGYSRLYLTSKLELVDRFGRIVADLSLARIVVDKLPDKNDNNKTVVEVFLPPPPEIQIGDANPNFKPDIQEVANVEVQDSTLGSESALAPTKEIPLPEGEIMDYESPDVEFDPSVVGQECFSPETPGLSDKTTITKCGKKIFDHKVKMKLKAKKGRELEMSLPIRFIEPLKKPPTSRDVQREIEMSKKMYGRVIIEQNYEKEESVILQEIWGYVDKCTHERKNGQTLNSDESKELAVTVLDTSRTSDVIWRSPIKTVKEFQVGDEISGPPLTVKILNSIMKRPPNNNVKGAVKNSSSCPRRPGSSATPPRLQLNPSRIAKPLTYSASLLAKALESRKKSIKSVKTTTPEAQPQAIDELPNTPMEVTSTAESVDGGFFFYGEIAPSSRIPVTTETAEDVNDDEGTEPSEPRHQSDETSSDEVTHPVLVVLEME